MMDQLYENDRIIDQFTEEQLNNLEIRIGKTKILNINEVYIEKSHNIALAFYDHII